MIILFTNTKGGTGKSTLAVLFTQFLINYFLDKAPHCIMLVDADYRQNSIAKLRHEDVAKLQELASGYEWNYDFYAIQGKDANDNRDETIAFTELNDIINIYNKKKEQGINTYLIVDLPGMLADIVISMVNIADMLIVPFEPTKFELNATTDFLNELKNISQKRADFLTWQQLFMVPNKMHRGIKYTSPTYVDLIEQEKQWKQIIPSLTITPPIPHSAHIKRTYSTAIITPQQAALVSSCFSTINYSSNLCPDKQ